MLKRQVDGDLQYTVVASSTLLHACLVSWNRRRVVSVDGVVSVLDSDCLRTTKNTEENRWYRLVNFNS